MRSRSYKRFFASLTAIAMLAAAMPVSPQIRTNPAAITASAADTGSRIRVDINANDGRGASYAENANNWVLVEGSSASYKVGGVTFKLSNGGSAGGNVTGKNNKKLQWQSNIYPRLTMDGATIKDGDNGGVLKLEISGLSNGSHSLQMWHCNVNGATNSKLSISVNGSKQQTGVSCPTNVTSEYDAGISYVTWSGSSVTILISPEGGGSANVAWLNGFELDGSDPFKGVSKMYPEDQARHWNIEDGLSWTAASGAKSHDVYIGTNYNSVFNATKSSAEYKGNQSGTTFALDDSYSSIPTYYWRVDTVDGNGNVIKGAVYSFQVNRLAFPTAEGYGRFARGGRGGTVYHVTNLNDDGKEGSLRYGIETLKGARTIVFDVGGIIELTKKLTIPSDGGDLYVAGQTAPGDGITLTKWGFGMLGARDVIIRDVHVRVGDRGLSGMNDVSDGMGLTSADHSIIDHCSISWATDEGFSSRNASNITFQWCIIGESLHDSIHYNGSRNGTETHAFAASISGYVGSFHHNLLIDCTGRNWSLAGGMEQDAVHYGGACDIRNNVVYNWYDRTTDGGVQKLNFVNNYYKMGAVSKNIHIVSLDGNELGTSDMQKMYVSGNVMMGTDGNYILKSTDDAWAKGKAKSGGKNSTDSDVKVTAPFFESYVNTQSAEDAYALVIANAGCNAQGYDYIDSRYQKEVKNGTYTYTGSKQKLKGILDSQKDAGGYPTSSQFKGGTAPTDSDRDGISDDWETAHGLNPKDASDGAIVSLSADDYTNLELFLNELAGDDVAYNGNVSYDPISGTLISSIEVLDTKYYNGWAVDTSATTGDAVFGDRTAEKCAIASLPANLSGAELILTPCDAKASSAEQATLTAAQSITLYVGLDSRVTNLPAWLSKWTKESDTITTTNEVTFNLYSVKLDAGETVTLGANGQSSGCMNYIVLASAGSGSLIGDVNLDGSVTIADAAALQQYLLTVKTLTAEQGAQADMDGNGRLNAIDLTMLKRVLIMQYEGKAKRLGFHYCKSLVSDGYLYVGYATNKEAVEITIVPEASLMLNQ